MREVRRLPPSGRVVASLFSGCGGSDLGFEMAGFTTVFASEFVEEARKTFALNFPGIPIDPRDIRELSVEDVLRMAGARAPGEIDVVIGSPPCASFSMGARREKGLEKGWGKEKEYGRRAANRQRTDDLFPELIRIVAGVRPKAFVAENVHGLLRGKGRGFFLEFIEAMQKSGYRVSASLLDASWLGVPQVRQRLIFVGLREDLGQAPTFPRPFPYQYTVAEAFGFEEPNVVEDDASIEGYAIEAEARKLEPGQKSAKFFNLRRLAWDAPARTVLASSGHPGAAGPLHPSGKRKPSIAELKAICGFPQDFMLTGTYEQRWERLGRAVPPPMMLAVALEVAERLAASGR